MEHITFRYFKKLPDFFLGIASVFDMGATIDIYHKEENANVADYKALKSDWEATGQDLQFALETYGQKQRK